MAFHSRQHFWSREVSSNANAAVQAEQPSSSQRFRKTIRRIFWSKNWKSSRLIPNKIKWMNNKNCQNKWLIRQIDYRVLQLLCGGSTATRPCTANRDRPSAHPEIHSLTPSKPAAEGRVRHKCHSCAWISTCNFSCRLTDGNMLSARPARYWKVGSSPTALVRAKHCLRKSSNLETTRFPFESEVWEKTKRSLSASLPPHKTASSSLIVITCMRSVSSFLKEWRSHQTSRHSQATKPKRIHAIARLTGCKWT